MVQSAQDSPTKTASVIQRFEPIYVEGGIGCIADCFTCGTIFTSLVMGNQHLSHDRLLSGCVAMCLGRQRGCRPHCQAFQVWRGKGSFKGGSYLANLTQLKAIAFDKTGTLTEGVPVVTDSEFVSDVDEAALTQIITAMEMQSNHPLANAIVSHYSKK